MEVKLEEEKALKDEENWGKRPEGRRWRKNYE